MGKKQKLEYSRNNRLYLMDFHAEMFTYDGLPDSIDPVYLERFLQLTGGAALVPYEGDWIAIEAELVPGARGLDVYGEGLDILGSTRNGHSIQISRDDGAFIHNNKTHTPCIDIWTDAARLAETDISIDFLIFWTRISPLIQTRDDKTRALIIDAFRAMSAGSPLTVTSKALLEDYIGSPDITVFPLTSPELADKIQYTAKLREDLERWHFTKYGQAKQNNSKTAQQSVEEVDGDTSISFILPYNMLNERIKGINHFNKISGYNASVRLSDAWKMEVEKYTQAAEAPAEADEEEGGVDDVSENIADTEGSNNNESI